MHKRHEIHFVGGDLFFKVCQRSIILPRKPKITVWDYLHVPHANAKIGMAQEGAHSLERMPYPILK